MILIFQLHRLNEIAHIMGKCWRYRAVKMVPMVIRIKYLPIGAFIPPPKLVYAHALSRIWLHKIVFAYCKHRNTKRSIVSINFASFFVSCCRHKWMSSLSDVRCHSCNYCILHASLIGIRAWDINRVSLHLLSSPSDLLWHLIFADKNNKPHSTLYFVLDIIWRPRSSDTETSSILQNKLHFRQAIVEILPANLQPHAHIFE